MILTMETEYGDIETVGTLPYIRITPSAIEFLEQYKDVG